MTTQLIETGILTLINTFSVFLVIVVLSNSSRDRLHLWLAVMAACLTGWVDSSYVGYSQPVQAVAIAAYRLNGVFVSGFVLAAYYFYIEGFLGIRKAAARWSIVLLTAASAFLNIATGEILQGVTRREWGNEIVFGPLNPLFSLFAAGFAAALIRLFMARYPSLATREKTRVRYFLTGTFLLIGFNVVFNVAVPAYTGSARYQHLGDYSAAVFLGCTAYAMLRERFLNVRVAAAAFLVSAMMTLLVVDILALSHSLTEQGVKTLALAFFVGISVLLVRSVLSETRQREELARANRELDRSRRRYIALAAEQKDIIDVMGHEIRTPLTAIVQEIRIHQKYTLPMEKELLKEANGRPNLKKILPYLLDTVRTVDRASAHAVALVTDMLETARLDKGRFTLNYEVFDLVSVVRDNVALMSKTVDASDPSVAYRVQFEDGGLADLQVEADRTRIGQAVYALLSNALKYRDPAKNSVHVSVSVRRKGDRAVVAVNDNGLGIDPADIPKLGRKFMRLDPRTGGRLPRPGGTGLGLFVVKGIMGHHHGEMRVASTGLGNGSIFSLEFPIRKP